MSLRAVQFITALVGLLGASAGAFAHPHVWVDARTTLLFDDAHRLTGLRQVWTFDEAYSAFAVTGLDADKDGKLSRAELEPLAEVNIQSLADFGYFTEIVDGKKPLTLTDPVDYDITYEEGKATLSFTLPLAAPLDPHGHDIAFAVFDPTIYVDFGFAKEEPIRLGALAPADCRTERRTPANAAAAAKTLSQYSEEQFSDPDSLGGLAAGAADRVRLICPAKEGPKS